MIENIKCHQKLHNYSFKESKDYELFSKYLNRKTFEIQFD